MLGQISEENVPIIISSTRCLDEQAWEGVINSYMKSYWRDFPEEAKEIAWRLIRSGRVIQPRLGESVGGALEGRVPLNDDGSVNLMENHPIFIPE